MKVLVTGAAGALGSAIVKRLRAEGHAVRAFQRRSAPGAREASGVEYAIGDLGDREAVVRAAEGIDVVVHCGATMRGTWADHERGTVRGTEHVVAAVKQAGVKQLVHISSMSVVDWAGSAAKGPVTEAAATEPRPAERGDYTRAKLLAENRVREAVAHGLPAVILRPGQIFGRGIPLVNGAVARNAAGRWIVLGDGTLELPLVYIDDVVDAVMAAIAARLVRGELFHIIDPEPLTQNEVLALAGPDRAVLRVPRTLVFALGKLSELPLRLVGKSSPIAAYRLRSALARMHYASDYAERALGWKPRVGVREGIRRESPEAHRRNRRQ